MFDAISSGLTQATMAQQPYKMGELSVEQAIGIVNGTGEELPAEQYQDTVLINKDNVATQDVTTFYGPDAKSAG
jgi:ribose transport system substrate-binding protein